MAKPAKDFPTSVRLSKEMVEILKRIGDEEGHNVNWMIRYAITKLIIDYKKEGFRDDLLVRLA